MSVDVPSVGVRIVLLIAIVLGLWLWGGTVHADEDVLKALAEARRAATASPDDPGHQLDVGRLLARLGAVEDALSVLDAVTAQAPTLAEPYLLGALLLRDADRHDEAIARLERAVAVGMDDPAVFEALGFLRLSSGDAARARAAAEATLEDHPQRGDALLLLGLSLAGEPARRDEAMAVLERALEVGVEPAARAHLELGALLVEAQRLEAALPHLEAARAALPNDPESHYRLGNALRAAGDLDGARAALERFQTLSRAADEADHGAKALAASLNEVQALALDNQLDEARSHLEALREAHPNAPSILALDAKIAYSMGDRAAALETMARAAAGEPARAEYHYLEGQFAVALGRLDQARRALQRAVAIEAGLAEAHRLLGLVHAQEGRFDQAASSLRRALDLGVEGPDVRRAFAEVLKRLGRQQESDEQMAAYRRLAGG